jgi:hypothetical protein
LKAFAVGKIFTLFCNKEDNFYSLVFRRKKYFLTL